MLVLKKVNIKISAKTQTLLQRFGEVATPQVQGAMQVVMQAAEAVAKEKAPKDQGLLQDSIAGTVEVHGPRIVGVLGSPLDYAAPMEYGTKAFWPPSAPLEEWVGRKFGLQGIERRSVAFLVRRAIARRGLRARKFMAAGVQKAQAIAPGLIGRALRTLERQLSDG